MAQRPEHCNHARSQSSFFYSNAAEKISPGKKVHRLVYMTLYAINTLLRQWDTVTAAVTNLAQSDAESEVPSPPDMSPLKSRSPSLQLSLSVDQLQDRIKAQDEKIEEILVLLRGNNLSSLPLAPDSCPNSPFQTVTRPSKAKHKFHLLKGLADSPPRFTMLEYQTIGGN